MAVCDLLEKALDASALQSPHFCLSASGAGLVPNSFRYFVNFTALEQVNTSTGKRRRVQREVQDGKLEALVQRAAFLKTQSEKVELNQLSGWATTPHAWPFWPAHVASGGTPVDRHRVAFNSSRGGFSIGGTGVQRREDDEPPWPPPPPPHEVASPQQRVPYEDPRNDAASKMPEMAAVLQQWQPSLLQCVAADGRKRNFSIERMDGDSYEAQAIAALLAREASHQAGPASKATVGFGAGTTRELKMRRCYRLQSLSALRAFAARRETMHASLMDDGLPPESLQTAFLWHGPSTRSALESIPQNGFDRLHCSGGMNAYGAGTYFARDPRLAANYAAKVFDAADHATRLPCKVIFLCAVLHDELTIGEQGCFPPPRKPHSPSGSLYTATADSARSIIVTYSDGQAIPLYIVCLEASATG